METGDSKPTGGPRPARTTKTRQDFQPLVPCANWYLWHKWDKASYERHREKVKSAKSALDTTPPKAYSNLAQGLKKKEIVTEKTQKIQRENALILNKILHIKIASGRIDNWNYYTKKSLGKERRQQEELRIQKENQKILLQITNCRSNYSVRDWHKDWHKHLKLMDSIAQYPRGFTSLQKGQNKPVKKPSGCDEEQNSGEEATTHSAESNNATGGEETEEETEEEEHEEAENPGAETEPDTGGAADPTEHAPSSDDIQVTDDVHSAETSPASDGCETSAEG